MNKSESIKELAGALAKAQAEMKNPAFDSANPHFKSKYASLAAVRDAVIPILSKHGISLSQFPLFEENKAGCENILMHSSGEFICSTLLLPVEKLNAHGAGSAQTYARRFSMMGIAGVVGDDDDDGNTAVGKGSVSTSVGPLPATITPTSGAWDNVPKERHEILNRIGSGVVDHFSAGDAEGAYEFLYEQALSSEDFICVWSLLDSKQRSALKKMRKEKTQLQEQA